MQINNADKIVIDSPRIYLQETPGENWFVTYVYDVDMVNYHFFLRNQSQLTKFSLLEPHIPIDALTSSDNDGLPYE